MPAKEQFLPAYKRFDTKDLQEAKALLEALQSGV
jgi:hypothetical protein